ncbi:MAG: extracellular solute-binding protein [Clostridia bacterium]|nr:extracellular solute-binding protein [Clostridia bacterium]
MKKFLSVMLGAVTAFSCFSMVACGGEKFDPNALVIEYYKAGYGDTWIKNLAAEYTKRYGQEVVTLPREGTTGLTKMEGSLTSGTAETDLFFAGSPSFGDIYRGTISAGGKLYDSWFADLTDLYESNIDGENVTVEDKMFDYFQEYFKMDTDDDAYYDQKYHFFPYTTGLFGIVVNVDVWNTVVGQDKAYPRTTDELLEICNDVRDNSNVAPFLYSLSEEYWTASLPVFMHQYEGDARMNNFYKGYGPTQDVRYDTNMVAYDGYKKALEFFAVLLNSDNGYMHSRCAAFDFNSMQGQFLRGQSLFVVNGEWLENEMIVNYPNSNIEMMKTPVLSAVADKCSFKDSANRDTILREIIDYVDGKTQTKPANCNDTDIEIVRSARKVEYVTGSSNTAYIPSYSNQIDSAKKFLRMMASDEGMKIFRNGTNGSEMPFRYTNSANAETPNASVFRQSVNRVLSLSEAKFVYKKDKIYSIGGIIVELYNNSYGRFVHAFKDGKATAAEYFAAEVSAVNSKLPGARQQANIK